MVETGIGVLVEDRFGLEQCPVPRPADLEVAHGDRHVVERWEGHRGLLAVVSVVIMNLWPTDCEPITL